MKDQIKQMTKYRGMTLVNIQTEATLCRERVYILKMQKKQIKQIINRLPIKKRNHAVRYINTLMKTDNTDPSYVTMPDKSEKPNPQARISKI